jgi:hypothetical protein
MISANSRYADSLLVTVSQNGKDRQVITPSNATSYTFNYVFTVTDSSDRLDTIANAFYGDPTKWWQYADANPEIMNWFDLDEGTTLRIPNT